MTDPPARPTRHADVDAILGELLAAVKQALGDNFAGMYVGGSLAAGAFDPETSDVDLLVATQSGVTDEQAAALRAAHERIGALASKWAKKLEILYVPRETLRTRDPHDDRCAYLGVGGWFGIVPYQSDWIVQLHLVREHGIVVDGPDPQTLIAPIAPDQLRSSIAAIVRDNWEPLLQDSSRFDAEYQAYAVLTMCRLLYTLEHRAIATKPQAAWWARQHLPAQWSALVEQAVAWRPGAAYDHLDDVLALVRHTLARTTEAPSTEPRIPRPA